MNQSSDLTEVHPVQVDRYTRKRATCPKVVTLRAYEVYEEVHGEQKAMIEGSCRGGFSAGEIIAFLYAHSFPRSEWRTRVSEAYQGMEGL